MRYAKYLGDALTCKLRDLQTNYLDVISLRDELAIFQAFFLEATQKYDKAQQGMAAAESSEEKLKFALASKMARDEAIEIGCKVKDMAVAAARIESEERAVSIGVVHGMLAQMCQMVDEELVLGSQGHVLVDPKSIACRIADRARTELLTVDAMARVRSNEASTTTLQPADAEAMAMDATVPFSGFDIHSNGHDTNGKIA